MTTQATEWVTMITQIWVRFTCQGCEGKMEVTSCKNLNNPIQGLWSKAYPETRSIVVRMQSGLKARSKKIGQFGQTAFSSTRSTKDHDSGVGPQMKSAENSRFENENWVGEPLIRYTDDLIKVAEWRWMRKVQEWGVWRATLEYYIQH
ncbi:uncharacterized protein LOC132903398 [Amyelois transitella]|uniref:uncharacterized protein LOC132903398 n=1 Tax=Amyelois transitella TaxID=680683 RepID=UPI0029903774|nr:uncharacterized protein LOC132903398 [Amyelois transitella]